MPRAYVLISAELGAEENLVHKLRSTTNIKEAHFVYGVYDVVVILEAPAMEELKQTIASKIRALPEVKSTLTMMVIE
jgi:DNA-binding Lrp family transcriptional regulator